MQVATIIKRVAAFDGSASIAAALRAEHSNPLIRKHVIEEAAATILGLSTLVHRLAKEVKEDRESIDFLVRHFVDAV